MFSRLAGKQAGFSLVELLVGAVLATIVALVASSFMKSISKDAARDSMLVNAEAEYETLADRLRKLLSNTVPGSVVLGGCAPNGYCREVTFQTLYRTPTAANVRVEAVCLPNSRSLSASGLKSPVCFDTPCDGQIVTRVTQSGTITSYPASGSPVLGTVFCVSRFERDYHVNLQAFYAESVGSQRIHSTGRIFSIPGEYKIGATNQYVR